MFWITEHPCNGFELSIKAKLPSPYMFMLVGANDRSFLLVASSAEEKEQWVAALSAVLHKVAYCSANEHEPSKGLVQLGGSLLKTDSAMKKWEAR